MKNKTFVMNQERQIRIQNWLCGDTQDDDFLMGKVAQDLSDTWEEEE